ncbi:hypothetical protein R1flu_005474 [Riccia fluitans]|uniref:Protein kinase domain-containing protein n=1 Tax=Riccia fluitans TaxID=41844 RepID=A0ABD1YT93_9MARC
MARGSRCTAGLCLLLLAVSFWSIRATPGEGVALLNMMNGWKVTFQTWTPGTDPCTGWEFVICTNGLVTSLNLTMSGLSGPLPKEIGQLSALDTLDVGNNQLEGEFPDELASCQQLRYLDITDNPWDIEFPLVITKLPKLEYLYASNAVLKGTLPKKFYDMRSLQYLFLGNNTNLTGNLEDFSRLTTLVNLTVWAMKWEKYELPDKISTLTNLKYFNCHDCNLVGSLPESWGNLKNLVDLDLRKNRLTGNIPESWKNLTRMYKFRIDTNFILAPFPNWVFTLWPNLTYLYLSRNLFYGVPYNISYLETTFNITSKFLVLRWDCNYISGSQPCSDRGNNVCSATSVNYTVNAQFPENARFSFDPNCYSDVNSTDYLQKVSYCIGHDLIGVCSDFETKYLNAKTCPVCPKEQQPVIGTSFDDGCRCQLSVDSSSGFSAGTIVGIVVGVAAFFLVVVGFLLYYKRKEFSFLDIFTKKHDAFDENWEAPPGVRRFTIDELAKMTSNFDESHIIGIGGFGKVYSGVLEDGRMVAIKRAALDGFQGRSEFRNEVTLLSRLHHRHLVKLEGFCAEKDFQVLIYEFMKRGNLAHHLHGDRENEGNTKLKEGWFTPLPWYKRLEIAHAVAQGLEYLHSFAEPVVIHRDVKPSNILLDDHMVAKLADFGISKAFEDAAENTHLSTRPAGTAGYLDPEYFLRRQLTTASDVYAYGVVLLELITGQVAIDHTREDEYNLIEWAKKRFKTAGIISIIDPKIADDYSRDAFTKMTDLALRCASFSKGERPTMKEVIAELDPLMVKAEKPTSRSRNDFSLTESDWLLARREIYGKDTFTDTQSGGNDGSQTLDISQTFGPR